ncbi:hypothetical protein [Paenibacillus sp. N3.4]|uniref:hypothetical protein n=1 Tax=Paenibacillus sp. N3.4 TaxID=2603222 RepID=UPI0011CA06DB|nr:hypothetical protein [Paenibacillus sp. N3.4]TXK83830.1 hypothetical protein FU659_12150 [Paenibacillus sp. N3.4]
MRKTAVCIFCFSIILSGCHIKPNETSSVGKADIQAEIKISSTFQNIAKTPDGKMVIEGQQEPTTYKDIDITINQQMDVPGHISYPNHSSVIYQEEVNITGEKATLLKISHDNFTAVTEKEKGARTDIIYWLYVTRPIPNDSNNVNTYILSATVIGNDADAKNEILDVAKTWNPKGALE